MRPTRFCITGALLFTASLLSGQDCYEYFRQGGCGIDLQRGYDIYSQSKSVTISPEDTIEFNMVFYGQKNYLFSLCTEQYLYPIHFCLIDPDNREVLYDNADDRFIESLEVSFDTSKSLAVRINVRAGIPSAKGEGNETGCIGLLIQYRNYPRNR